MFDSKIKIIHVICLVLFCASLFLLYGCGDKNDEVYNDNAITESYADMTQSTKNVATEKDTLSKPVTASDYNKTESSTTKSKSWKEAYIDYIYDLDESYDCIIRYQPLMDLNNDGITDFVCRLYNDEVSTDKDIVVVYDHGDLKTLSKTQILGIDNDGRVFFTHTADDYSKVDGYVFKSGSFVFDTSGNYLDYSIGDLETAPSYNKSEMISEINRGLII